MQMCLGWPAFMATHSLLYRSLTTLQLRDKHVLCLKLFSNLDGRCSGPCLPCARLIFRSCYSAVSLLSVLLVDKTFTHRFMKGYSNTFIHGVHGGGRLQHIKDRHGMTGPEMGGVAFSTTDLYRS